VRVQDDRQSGFARGGRVGDAYVLGFYFLLQAFRAQAGGGVGGKRNRREVLAPAGAMGIAGHGFVAIGAAGLHGSWLVWLSGLRIAGLRC
jgi:hypothetical protein